LTNTVCQKIVENTNAEAVLLHSAHNVTPQEFKDGATYLSIMKTNIKALERGLCE
jgi:zinc transport system substrate-binding protein